jgi:polysaccharide export outer membrane protein
MLSTSDRWWPNKRAALLRTGVAGVLLASSFACTTAVHPTLLKELPRAEQAPPEPGWEYKIQVGDEMDIKFYFNPELTEHVVVRPDGRISLQLVPEVMAFGLTPHELTELLKKEYASELSKPELTVMVRTFSANHVFVGGEVQKPGEVKLVGRLTTLQSIMAAEGLKETAKVTEVLIIRRNPDRTPRVIPVNLKRAISGVDIAQDLELMPFDVVYVPKSGIANLNKFVDQYIRQNIPIHFGYVLRTDVTDLGNIF